MAIVTYNPTSRKTGTEEREKEEIVEVIDRLYFSLEY
jgi:hypothetical protein